MDSRPSGAGELALPGGHACGLVLGSRRRWILAPLRGWLAPQVKYPVRSTTTSDDLAIAELLDAAYLDTIDFDPDADHIGELETWRTQDGARDDASFVATDESGRLVGACLIGHELGAAFLYEIVTHPDARRRGIATHLLARSVATLTNGDDEHLAAWVSDGNTASEELLSANGFRTVTRPLGRDQALGLYRAAGAVRSIEPPDGARYAVTSDDGGPTLWVIKEQRDPASVEVNGTTVTVQFVDEDSADIPRLADQAMPINGAAWLLAHRTPVNKPTA